MEMKLLESSYFIHVKSEPIIEYTKDLLTMLENPQWNDKGYVHRKNDNLDTFEKFKAQLTDINIKNTKQR